MGTRTMTKTRPTGWVEMLNWPEQSFSRNRKYHAQMSWHTLVTKTSLEWNVKVIEYKNKGQININFEIHIWEARFYPKDNKE